jgi:hypothetical protein
MGKKFYDWAEVQRFVDEGHGFVDAQKRFGFSHTAWIKAIRRKALSAGERPLPIGDGATTGRRSKPTMMKGIPSAPAPRTSGSAWPPGRKRPTEAKFELGRVRSR